MKGVPMRQIDTFWIVGWGWRAEKLEYGGDLLYFSFGLVEWIAAAVEPLEKANANRINIASKWIRGERAKQQFGGTIPNCRETRRIDGRRLRLRLRPIIISRIVLGRAEVNQLDTTRQRENEIGWLNVAMSNRIRV